MRSLGSFVSNRNLLTATPCKLCRVSTGFCLIAKAVAIVCVYVLALIMLELQLVNSFEVLY